MKKILSWIIMAAMTAGVLSGCSGSSEAKDDTTVNAVMLKGPTGIGAAKLMADSEDGKTEGNYNITLAASPDDVTGKILNGEVDIAAAPTNLAPVLYNKTNGEISVLAVNTLGVLYIVENGDTIHDISDLSGKTIYSAGQGAVPEYILDYILEKNDVKNVNIEYKSEHAETASALLSGEADIALLPEPNVTAVEMKNDKIRTAIDISDEWDKVSKNNMAMGCIIVRNDFLNNHNDAVITFLKEYEQSINYVNANVSDAAQLVEKYEIMSSAQAAEKAIPNCNIVYIDGSEMKDILEGFYKVLFAANEKSVGGKLPEEVFYYVAN